jgi:hypothetical protein
MPKYQADPSNAECIIRIWKGKRERGYFDKKKNNVFKVIEVLEYDVKYKPIYLTDGEYSLLVEPMKNTRYSKTIINVLAWIRANYSSLNNVVFHMIAKSSLMMITHIYELEKENKILKEELELFRAKK